MAQSAVPERRLVALPAAQLAALALPAALYRQGAALGRAAPASAYLPAQDRLAALQGPRLVPGRPPVPVLEKVDQSCCFLSAASKRRGFTFGRSFAAIPQRLSNLPRSLL